MTRKIFLFVAAALLSVNTYAQQGNKPTAPAPPSTTPRLTEGKVMIIDTSAFADPKNGITRLSAAVAKVDAEFQQQGAELQKLKQQHDALIQDINKTKDLANPQATQQKVEQADALKRSLERKAEDGQLAYNKKMQEAVGGISSDILQSLNAFVQKRGITLLLDASKLQSALLYASAEIDITREFISEYNQQKPKAAFAPEILPNGATVLQAAK